MPQTVKAHQDLACLHEEFSKGNIDAETLRDAICNYFADYYAKMGRCEHGCSEEVSDQICNDRRQQKAVMYAMAEILEVWPHPQELWGRIEDLPKLQKDLGSTVLDAASASGNEPAVASSQMPERLKTKKIGTGHDP